MAFSGATKHSGSLGTIIYSNLLNSGCASQSQKSCGLVWMPKFSAPYGPCIDLRTGWTQAKFVCVGDVEPKTRLQVW